MESFKRLLKYILPQWHSIIAIFICVVVIGILYSASFMTIIPMLKILMGNEGIHGWVDRKICNIRYGIDFSVPSSFEIIDSDKEAIYHLNVINVKKSSPGFNAGIIVGDRIIAVDKTQLYRTQKIQRSEMLRILSRYEEKQQITILINRSQPEIFDQLVSASLSTDIKPFYIDTIDKLMSNVSIDKSDEAKIEAVRLIIVLLLIATAIRCLARFFQEHLSNRIVNISLSRLRSDTFRHIIDMPIGYFSSEGTSDTVSRIIRDSDEASYGIKFMLGKALREPFKAVLMIAGAMILNWQIVLIIIITAPIFIATVGTIGKKMRKSSHKSLTSWSVMLRKLQDSLKGIAVMKVYNQADNEISQFSKINDQLLNQQNKISKLEAATGPLLESISMIACSAALIYALNWVFSGNMDKAEFFTVPILLGTAAQSLRKSSDVWNVIQRSNAASERIFDIIDQPKEKDAEDALDIFDFKEEIQFKQVLFTYPKSKDPILHGINLTVKAGQNIAIVGQNGSGKTTLLNLLPRFYDYDSGQILIDGVDISKISLKSIRSMISIVSQQNIIFNDTIAANIAYGRIGCSMNDVVEAAKQAYCDEFISLLPNGYDTLIGESGTGLSGGQMQRIVVARAIIKDPKIVIFDEAMSQIDSESETKIYKALEKFLHNRTSFVIAHRLSTIINSDLIAVIDEGRVVATGSHANLIEKCPFYRRLYETQQFN